MSKKSLDEIIKLLQSQKQQKESLEDYLWEQREKARIDYLKRNQIYEKTAFTPSSSSSAAGGGRISITEVESIYWALLFTPDSISGQNYFPQSIDKDSSGNIYIASIDESNSQKSIVRKISSSGNLLLEKVLFNSGSDADMEVSRILSVNDGVIILYKGGVRKLDTNGNLIWSFLQNITDEPLELTSLCENLAGDSIYVFGIGDGGSSFEIFQLDLATGTISFNKRIVIISGGIFKSDSDIVIDSSGNIILSLSYGNGITYDSTILKIDPIDADPGVNIISEWTILSSSYDNNSQRISALAIDQNDEIVVHGDTRGITKIASDMSGAIAVLLDIVLGSQAWDSKSLAVTSSGDIFVVGEDGPKIKIVKLSSGLLPQFSYTIESATATISLAGYYSSMANSSIEIVDDIMFITANYDNQELIFKLPLTNMSGYPDTSSVTYGDFTFTNSPIIQDTVSITTQVTTPVTSDSTWISNDVTLSTGFTSPSNSQTQTKTSLD